MDGLQRSAVSFRRQGSSGLVWDDKLISGELKPEQEVQELKTAADQQPGDGGGDGDGGVAREIKPIKITVERSRSTGEKRGYRTGKVSPAIDPPSPRVSACGFCGGFGKVPKNQRNNNKKAGKRRLR